MVAAQLMIGLVVLLGLLAFLSLNPYLITVFAFAQVFIIIGVVLFLIALIASRRARGGSEPDQDGSAADLD
jgi:hypothetical protein